VLDAKPNSDRSIDLEIGGSTNLADHAVLIRTGWDSRWGTDRYWELGPFLSELSVDALIDARPSLVGVDFWNIDDVKNPYRTAHSKLLSREILIVEHLCSLSSLPSEGFKFYAIPLKIVKGASFLLGHL
jgi:arylformamidase